MTLTSGEIPDEPPNCYEHWSAVLWERDKHIGKANILLQKGALASLGIMSKAPALNLKGGTAYRRDGECWAQGLCREIMRDEMGQWAPCVLQ